MAAFILAFGLSTIVCMLPVLLNGDLHYFWHDSVSYQSGRVTPFSLWGFYGGLSVVQHVLEGAVVAGAVLLAFVPERRGIVEVAALAAAIMIALQIVGNYWLYPVRGLVLPARRGRPVRRSPRSHGAARVRAGRFPRPGERTGRLGLRRSSEPDGGLVHRDDLRRPQRLLAGA